MTCCFSLRPFAPVAPPPGTSLPITIGGGFDLPAGSFGLVNVENHTSGPITITLPPAPALGQSLKFKDVLGNSGTYNIIIDTVGSTIDGYPTYSLVSNFMSIEVYWMGTQWGTI